jgi:ribosomal protein S18 acetylase RimI-like enzyme
MPTFSFEPPLPTTATTTTAFVQTIRVLDEGKLIGQATWSIPAIDNGVLQILTLDITASQRRQGHARQLLLQAIKQGDGFCKLKRRKLRKAWMLVRQKEQIIGRSFLTGQSFHHVSTINNLFKDEDALVYVRAFD